MKKQYIYLLSIIFIANLLIACGNELVEINENPNATENPDPAYLLSAAQYHAADLYWGGTTSYNSTLLWIQQWAKIQYTEPDCYNVSNSDFTTTWNTAYSTIIKNLETIERSEESNENTKVVARIWKDWTYLLLTNLYGDIPYTEFAKSVTPAYDSQEKIFRSLLSELDANASSLNTSGGTVSGDLIYNGDITKWKKFANSLRLRIALEIADRDESTAKDIISNLYNNTSSIINGNEDIAKFVFSSSPQWNPWASAFSSRDDQRVSKTLIDKLKEFNDPRLSVFAQLPQDKSVSTYEGAANGLSADAANNQGFYKVSRPGTYFLESESPAVFFTYAEVLFDFAEAAARGFITSNAELIYRQAITASLNQFNITNVDSYLAQLSIAYNPSRWYESIGWQKWIAYYGQGPDAFTDWRRLGYPILQSVPNSSLSSGSFPRRFFYPSTEQSLNGENYKVAVADQGEDEITTRLWFDVENKKR